MSDTARARDFSRDAKCIRTQNICVRIAEMLENAQTHLCAIAFVCIQVIANVEAHTGEQSGELDGSTSE